MHSDFKDKPIYVKGKELYVLVNKVMTSKTPYPLKDQILRAAISIVLNFSEGYGRFTNKDKKNFYIIARASLNETIACFDLLSIHEAISETDVEEFNELANELSRMLSGLINSQK